MRIAIAIALAVVGSPAVGADDSLPDSPSSLDADLARTFKTRTFDFADVDLDVETTLHLEPGDAELLRTSPTNPRIIDLDRAHRRDCALDRIRGGLCIMRLDEEPDLSIDVGAYGHDRAQRGRFEILDRILETEPSRGSRADASLLPPGTRR